MTESETEKSDIERTTLNIIESIKATASENSRILLVGGLGVAVLNWAGIISLGLPSWWPIAFVVVAAGVVAGWMASDRLYDLIPGEEMITLVAFHSTDGTGGEIWQLHPDEFEDMEVLNGELYQWDSSPKRCYEVRDYDPEQNRAIANWRETKPASELVEQRSIEDVLAEIEELREMLEPEARRARKLRRQLPGIVRILDAQRDAEVNESLEAATVDSDIDEATISAVLEDVLGEELTPHPDAVGENGHSEIETVEFSRGVDKPENESTVDQDEYDAILGDPMEGG